MTQSKQELPRAKFLELSRIIEKHLPYFKFFAYKPKQTIYSKSNHLKPLSHSLDYNPQTTYLVVKGGVLLLKECKREIVYKQRPKKLSIDRTNNPSSSEWNSNPVTLPTKTFKTEEPEFSTLSSWASETTNQFNPIRRDSKVSEKASESSYSQSNKDFTHLRRISSKISSTLNLKPQNELQYVGPKLVLHRKVNVGEVFGVVENENSPEHIAVSDEETWVVTFSMKHHKRILEDQKKYNLKIYNLLESILQRTFDKQEIITLAHYFDEFHPLPTDKIYAEGEPSTVFYFLVHGSVFLLKDIDGKTLYESKHMFKKLVSNQKTRIVKRNNVLCNDIGGQINAWKWFW